MAVQALPFRYAQAANSTSTAFTDFNATSTEPSGTGIFDLTAVPYGNNNSVPTWLQLVPFGAGSDDQTFDMRVYGYTETVPADLVTDTKLYIPQLLLDISCTMCARTFSDHAASTFLVDTITVNDGAADNGWRSLIDCQENMAASVVIHSRGCRFLRFDFDMTGATSGNCLWRGFE